MNKKLNKNNGITLISLVITIIVMLILVGVSITLAVNGGLFEYAGNAVGDTKNTMKQEQDLIDDIIENHIKPNTGEVIIGNDGEKFSAIYEQTTKITQNEGDKTYTAWIPKGFAVGTSEKISKISTGLVIRDTEGNEFVWIPVEVVKQGENADSVTSIASFYRSAWSENKRTTGLSASYTEPYASGYTGEDTDYNDMLKSVYTYEGFYIGRYEAGTETPRTSNTTGTTEDWVVQRDKYPYIYVGWGASMTNYTDPVSTYGNGALYLCKNFYTKTDKVGVTSTLCYGVMWDAMLEFISTEKNVVDSTTWGNYKNNTGDTWKITRTTAKWTTSPSSDTDWETVGKDGKTKTSSSSILLTTGANDNFSAKNIYDIAGNVGEWTNEAYSTTVQQRVRRGANYAAEGSDYSGAYREFSKGYCPYYVGFRPALYITNND